MGKAALSGRRSLELPAGFKLMRPASAGLSPARDIE
jgi:hypothetical protein